MGTVPYFLGGTSKKTLPVNTARHLHFHKSPKRFLFFGKTEEFSEIFQRAGGVIFDLKNFIANLVRFGPVCGKNCNLFSEKGTGGGDQRSFRNFPKFHPFWSAVASLTLLGSSP